MPIAKDHVVLAAALSLMSGLCHAADLQAGKSVSQAQCGQCHEADDWEGEGAASLESLIRDIVAGKVKHKTRLQLTDAQIADIAAYWGQPGRKPR
jgi:mono/diheme cytochrome c family protein